MGGVVLSVATQAQVPGAAAGSILTFTLDRTGAAAAHYSVQLDQATGKGVYRGAVPVSGTSAPTAGTEGAAAAEGSPITVSAGALQKAFAAVPLVRSNRCESYRKGIAQTGTKTLRLVRNSTAAECSFNYSEDDRVNVATAVFEAVAETMQYGERLGRKLRFDRLGLDAEMEGLQAALSDGRALEVGNIAPVLQKIQNDDRVMERVRRKAAHLLETAGVAPAARQPELLE